MNKKIISCILTGLLLLGICSPCRGQVSSSDYNGRRELLSENRIASISEPDNYSVQGLAASPDSIYAILETGNNGIMIHSIDKATGESSYMSFEDGSITCPKITHGNGAAYSTYDGKEYLYIADRYLIYRYLIAGNKLTEETTFYLYNELAGKELYASGIAFVKNKCFQKKMKAKMLVRSGDSVYSVTIPYSAAPGTSNELEKTRLFSLDAESASPKCSYTQDICYANGILYYIYSPLSVYTENDNQIPPKINYIDAYSVAGKTQIASYKIENTLNWDSREIEGMAFSEGSCYINNFIWYIDDQITSIEELSYTPRAATGSFTVSYQEEKGILQVSMGTMSSGAGLGRYEIAVWTEENGQDDLKWYTTVKDTIKIRTAAHYSKSGKYIIHLYLVDGNGNRHFISEEETSTSSA